MMSVIGHQTRILLQASADVRGAEGVVPLALPAAHRLPQEPLDGLRAAVPRSHLKNHDGGRAGHQRLGLVSRGEIDETN